MIKIAPSIGCKGIGIVSVFSHIDHIVPLSQLVGADLLLTDPYLREQIEYFYPPMKIICELPEDGCLDETLKEYDFFIYTQPCRSASGLFKFYNYYTTLPVRSIFTHHGNSEKCFDYHWFEKLIDEDILLVYGEHMLQKFRKIGVTKPMIKCGNYRLFYYLKHKEFFDSKTKLPHKEGEKKVLYAPTWSAKDWMIGWRQDHSPFFTQYQKVLDNIPRGYHLYVKLHPNYFVRMPDEVQQLQDSYQNQPQITFIETIPAIYPLLNQMDIYVGDFSSVGYDFLYFNRPMFFISDERQREIFACGSRIDEKSLWERIEEDQSSLASSRERLYQLAFGKSLCELIS